MGQTKSYSSLETFRNECVSIYRRAASKSLNYHTRRRVPGVTGYIINSCKTPIGTMLTGLRWICMRASVLKFLAGESINAPSINGVIDEFLTNQKSKSPNRYRDLNNTIGNHFRTYTEGRKIDWIDSLSVVGYFYWRREQSRYGRKTSENTINSESGEVLRFLRWRKDRKYLR